MSWWSILYVFIGLFVLTCFMANVMLVLFITGKGGSMGFALYEVFIRIPLSSFTIAGFAENVPHFLGLGLWGISVSTIGTFSYAVVLVIVKIVYYLMKV